MLTRCNWSTREDYEWRDGREHYSSSSSWTHCAVPRLLYPLHWVNECLALPPFASMFPFVWIAHHSTRHLPFLLLLQTFWLTIALYLWTRWKMRLDRKFIVTSKRSAGELIILNRFLLSPCAHFRPLSHTHTHTLNMNPRRMTTRWCTRYI